MTSQTKRGRTGADSLGPTEGGPGVGESSSSNNQENIKVAVRLRPFTERERQRHSKRIVDIEQNTVALYNPKILEESAKKFTFDHSYWSHDGFKRNQDGVNVPDAGHPNSHKYVGQERVFADLGEFLLENALEGYNSAILAYGQTGSGKSYTVSGYGQNEGILPRFARELFSELDRRHEFSLKATSPEVADAKRMDRLESSDTGGDSSRRTRYEVHFSMIEIYNEVVRDLLAKENASTSQTTGSSIVRRGLRVREHPKKGFFVENLSSYPCTNKSEIENLIEEGQLNKSIAATSMNETSSRGHTIYEFTIRQYRIKDDANNKVSKTVQSSETNTPPKASPTPTRTSRGTPLKEERSAIERDDVETMTTSVVQLVDLAGSERMTVHVASESGGASDGLAARSASPLVDAAEAGRSARIVRSSTSVRRNLGPASASSSSSSVATTSQSSRRPPSQQLAGKSQAGSTNLLNSNHQQRFKESVSINQSLSALGNCIQVLSQFSQQQFVGDPATGNGSSKAPKIPYRDSVLTKLLNRCCLSGNSKVVLIATLSPADVNYDDTLSTLRFADRAKQIRTHAIINRTTPGPGVANLQRENERLKQILDGRVTRSDDSSQTSNFDESENVQDNFNGPQSSSSTDSPLKQRSRSDRGGTVTKARAATKAAAGSATASMSSKKPKTNLRLAQENLLSSKRQQQKELGKNRNNKSYAPTGSNKLKGSVSNPALAAGGLLASNQMEQLVSSAEKKMRQKTRPNNLSGANGSEEAISDDEKLRAGMDEVANEQGLMRKSRSLGQGLAELSNGEFEIRSELLDEIDLNELAEIIDDENLLSPDSDDSFNNNGASRAKFDDNMTNEEKAVILNRLLSNSNVANKIIRKQIESSIGSKTGGKMSRPRKAGAKQHVRPTKRASLAGPNASSQRSSPYLSNLNPDEQLTGMISYNFEPGVTIVGKDESSDLLIYGPAVRGQHARLTRDASKRECFVEPIVDDSTGSEPRNQSVAVFVNGELITQRTRLNDGDRLLFGSNNYFVFVQNNSGAPADNINYDMARSEVMQKIISESENEAMLKEIKDYTHRPGTGKKKSRHLDDKPTTIETNTVQANALPEVHDGKYSRQESEQNRSQQQLDNIREEESGETQASKLGGGQDQDVDELYKSKLIADTHELAMPIAEANAIARDMGIRVNYGLKILTGEEQLLGPLFLDELQMGGGDDESSNHSLAQQDSGSGHAQQSGNAQQQQQATHDEQDQNVERYVTRAIERPAQDVVVSSREPIKPETLDVPPELYVHVHLEEILLDFYWSKEKFQERRVKMLELYGAWDVGGKSGLVEYLIEQSKYQGYYMMDPFIDDIKSSWVLVGHAQVTLQPVSRVAGMRESFDVLDVNDEIVGSVFIEALPCHCDATLQSDPTASEWPYRPMDEEELRTAFLDDSRQLLEKEFVFLLKIDSCSRVPFKFSQVFCQYTLNKDLTTIRTRLVTRPSNGSMEKDQEEASKDEEQTSTFQFDHKHFIVIDRMTTDILDFLQNGFLAIQLVGQYDSSCIDGLHSAARRSTAGSSSSSAQLHSAGHQSQRSVTSAQPTLVSTIINSINKYRFRMEQQSAAYANLGAAHFPNQSAYATSLSESANSASYRIASSSVMNSNSGPSSVTSASATINLFDQQNEDDDGLNFPNGNQENIIDMILTKRKLDRAENQLHYIKRTINIAEHHNKKHIPVRTVKKLLNSYGQELEAGNLEEMTSEVTTQSKSNSSKNSTCTIQ